jgi:autotransporter-associated beta strand protein
MIGGMKNLSLNKLRSCSIAILLCAVPAVAFAESATWLQSPTTDDWNTAANWTPNTVPNGPSDVATFNISGTDSIFLSETTDVDMIYFPSTALAFTINVGSQLLNFDGAGLVNKSGYVENITLIRDTKSGGGIVFHNTAQAGDAYTYYVLAGLGATMMFEDSSSAADANINLTESRLMFYDTSTAENALVAFVGDAEFYDNSTAANAVFDWVAGSVSFYDDSRAANATITCSDYGNISFDGSATAAQGHFTINGGGVLNDDDRFIDFAGGFGGEGTFVVNGGTEPSAAGAKISFFSGSHAENATLTANGGTNGGEGASIFFDRGSDGGMASITLNGNGTLNLAKHAKVTTGSIAGDGLVFLGQNKLTVGSNNTSTKFSGVIQDGAQKADLGITKIGTGTWTLTGANTYAGGTTLVAGGLTIDNKHGGSGTGTGAVQVNGGTLAGSGIIAGATTLGTGSGAGALLAPGVGAGRPVTLTMQGALTFQSDATLQVRLDTGKVKTDAVAANGVSIASGAQFVLQNIGGAQLGAGTSFTVINNTSANPIVGAFANLTEGSILRAGRNRLLVSYAGGDGNDLTLTVQ